MQRIRMSVCEVCWLMKSLVIGKGQIGQALFEIFSEFHECYIRDIQMEQNDPGETEVLHIAYPYSENFVDNTLDYIKYYKPKLTIIHSSVSVGTTDECLKGAEHIVHSPERGRFPNLAFEMRQFRKFVGGRLHADLQKAQLYFDQCNWPSVLVGDPKLTELLKLLSNIHLGLEVAWRQEVDRMFSAFGITGTTVYSVWEDSYNKGHARLGHKQLIRPTVRPEPIGGHCILPCTDILSKQFKSAAFEFIKESNEKRKTEEASGKFRSSIGKASGEPARFSVV